MSRRRRDSLPAGEIADGVWAIGPWGYTYTVAFLVNSTPGLDARRRRLAGRRRAGSGLIAWFPIKQLPGVSRVQ